ncbi:glycosyltransferase family 2 protein [Alteromonas oceanisediminis]|uniref:glycosyltransferase family 2 protein n=1 Tax=Alteromonas oceanisediminis TaxID=2836180 RepID=UPI001BD936D8|nr:glycosyltransferase [Alteromonas oceanisediminis]MBT0587083.1 glycosyltransferase [Alteromonas oceanisediminis]
MEDIFNCRVSVILVTYHHNDGALDRITAIRESFEHYTITVLDNSSEEYKARGRLRARLHEVDPTIRYVDHAKNCRFTAYNEGLAALESEFTIFRTDDDVFYEGNTWKLLENGFFQDFVTTSYIYNGNHQQGESFRRPIESIIVKSHVLHSLLPFEQKAGSDWMLMEKLFQRFTWTHYPTILLNKRAHGREVVKL